MAEWNRRKSWNTAKEMKKKKKTPNNMRDIETRQFDVISSYYCI